jgi:hypothetical protein
MVPIWSMMGEVVWGCLRMAVCSYTYLYSLDEGPLVISCFHQFIIPHGRVTCGCLHMVVCAYTLP